MIRSSIKKDEGNDKSLRLSSEQSETSREQCGYYTAIEANAGELNKRSHNDAPLQGK